MSTLSRRRSGVLLGDLRRSAHAGHDLVDQHEHRVEHGRRQDVVQVGVGPGGAGRVRRARRSPRRRVRPDRPEPHPRSATTAALYDDATTTARRGASSRTCRSRSTTASASATRSRSTRSAAARRTTSRCAVRRARRTRSASAPATGTSSTAATASRRGPIRAIRNIVYATSQDGGLARFDRRTGRGTGIRPAQSRGGGAGPVGGGDATAPATPQAPPQARAGAAGEAGPAAAVAEAAGAAACGDRTNWDAPYIISPHSNTRLYWAQQYLYRTDDRGDSWTRISPDLTRNLDSAEHADHGQGVAAGFDRAARIDHRPQQHRLDRRIAAAAKACSTSAPTTACCRSPRTAARPGARSRTSRACRSGRTSPTSSPRRATRTWCS